MNGVRLITALSGPLVLVAFALGSLAHTRLRRAGRSAFLAALAVATSLTVWLVAEALAPGVSRFGQSSAVGFLSSQVLTVWEALALWSGAAFVIGSMIGLDRTDGFRLVRGDRGLGPAAALLALHLPLTLVPAVFAGVGARAVSVETRPTVIAAVLGAISTEWMFSVLDPATPWGVVHGPETALWALVLGGALLVREGLEPGDRNGRRQ